MNKDTIILARLESLEMQVHRWRKASAFLLLGLTVLMVCAAAPQRKETDPSAEGFVQQVPANRWMALSFVLVGKDGKQYARLALDNRTPVLEFYDTHRNITWSFLQRMVSFRPGWRANPDKALAENHNKTA